MIRATTHCHLPLTYFDGAAGRILLLNLSCVFRARNAHMVPSIVCPLRNFSVLLLSETTANVAELSSQHH